MKNRQSDVKQDIGHQDRIETEARHWVVYLNSGEPDPAQLAVFDSWLGADPAHRQAFEFYERLMADIALLPAPVDPPPIAARLPWYGQLPPRSLVAAGAAVLSLIAGIILVQPRAGESGPGVIASSADPYATGVAEIRDVILEDGSRVTLGAASRIEPVFSDSMRVVTLYEGEAFFDVTPDPGRPFYVGAGDRQIRVVGTSFDVRQGRETVRIAVVEGIVEVIKAQDPFQAEAARVSAVPDVLRAGDEVVARIGSAEKTKGVIEPQEAAPWRRGWLSYENASLAEIIDDANRYSRRQLVLTDDSLSTLRMTAAFSAEKIDQFAMGLEVSYGLEVDYTQPDRILLMRPEGR